MLGIGPQTLSAMLANIRIGTNEHAEISQKWRHPADRLRRHRPPITRAVRIGRHFHHRPRQEILEPCGYADRSRARTAAAMRRGESLVQIEVDRKSVG